MDELFATLINIAFYIFIFRMIGGLFSKKKPQQASKRKSQEEPVIVEKIEKKKNRKSFLEEAMEQIKKLEEIAKEPEKKRKKIKTSPVVAVQSYRFQKDEVVKPVTRVEKVIDEKNEEIYYNDVESQYTLNLGELKKAIVYSEIIGKPVSKRIGMPYRR